MNIKIDFFFIFSIIKIKPEMPLLYRIEDINECLQNIERVYDPGYFTIHTIIGRNTYEFKFNIDNTCSESVGVFTYLGCDVDTYDKTEDDIMVFSDIVGENITTIKFVEKQDNRYDCNGNTYGSIFVKFLNDEEDVLFTLEFYNCQNGYYPHDLIVNLYEGDSYEGLQIFKTCI